jgi:serine phosphatase RsbU (regulator of sigma subunit)
MSSIRFILISHVTAKVNIRFSASAWMVPMAVLLAAMLFTACSSNKKSSSAEATRMLEEASDQRDAQRLLTLADSLAKVGKIRDGESQFWQGLAYYRKGDLSLAEFYWQESIDATSNSTNATDLHYYAKSTSYLSSMYCRYGEFAKNLQMSLPVLKRLEQLECDTTSDYTNLIIFTGCAKAHFDKNDTTAIEMFEQAYEMHNRNIRAKATKDAYHDAVAGLINIAYGWNREGDYEKGLLWTERFGQYVAEYRERFSDDEKYIDRQWGRYKVFRATALVGLGRLEEADSDYADYQQTRFSKSMEGMTNSSDYLTLARRWNEALSCYSTITDYLYQEFGMYSLENIQRFMLKKYRANAMTGNNDSTNLAARQICEVLDSAIMRARRVDAEGIQNIHKKDTEILQQQTRSAELRKINYIIMILTLIVAFSIFTIIRHRAAKRLARVNAAKERMEGELSIARDIQKSMVPSTFPQREGLDMYASMTPAREVGGDLYSYLQKGDVLYFCIGDVSGKGVPAAIFMAVSRTLIRATGIRGVKPSECITYSNSLLAEESANSMFVTIFYGIYNVKTGEVTYSNAGHNPPYVVKADGSLRRLPMSSDIIAGFMEDISFKEDTFTLEHGDTLMLYTDGVTEAVDTELNEYGERRLEALLKNTPHDGCQQMIDAVKADVKAFTGDAEQSDDITLLALKRL